MDLNNLKPADGAVHKEGKRVGRGEGSGKGGNCYPWAQRSQV